MSADIAPKVGIIIPTKDRPDFMIRQLEYYAKAKSPHSVYISDASNDVNSKKLQRAIQGFSERLTINYSYKPHYTVPEANLDLYRRVKEKYTTTVGDDDYQIPASLTKCAEFLENNPIYSSASGRSVSVRILGNGAHGEIKRIAYYPLHQIEDITASRRLLGLMANYSPTAFAINRTEQMVKCWDYKHSAQDMGFAYELIPHGLSLIWGKTKVLDCLSLVRQFDNQKRVSPNTLEWLTSKNWHSSYGAYCEILAKEISGIDGISIYEARKITEQSVWIYLNIWLPFDYKKTYGSGTTDSKIPGSLLRKLRLHIGQSLPRLKNIYTQMRHSLPNAPQDLSYEVTRPSSIYYEDFRPVLDSIEGK